jgi:signal transduction histidine kinase
MTVVTVQPDTVAVPFARPADRFRGTFWVFGVGVLGLAGGVTLFTLAVTFIGLIPLVVLVPATLLILGWLRRYADVRRLWCAERLGVPIARPYRPEPTGGWVRRLRWYLSDRATWRDLMWLLVDATAGFTLAILPATLLGATAFYLVYPLLFWVTPRDVFGSPFGFFMLQSWNQTFLLWPVAALAFGLFWTCTPPLLRAYGRLTKSMLAPRDRDRLTARIAHLAESRADTVDTQAAELRRIERDLHDGAQARLVALGMNLGMAEELLATDPDAAQELLVEARESTGLALSELRALVRGIHPPVLADRGLDGAVRALALAAAVPVEVSVDLPGRLPAPVESATYFAVAEVLTNVAKHSGATSAWLRVVHEDGRLCVMVGDDGRGGADVVAGGGLHGVTRRLAAFDGTMGVASPIGGPTIVTMELPCVLS